MPASPSIDVTKFPLSDKLRKEPLSETATARLTYSSGAKR
jgi:hypothetical protein